eukprot:2547876-Amphidinium_carterae.1
MLCQSRSTPTSGCLVYWLCMRIGSNMIQHIRHGSRHSLARIVSNVLHPVLSHSMTVCAANELNLLHAVLRSSMKRPPKVPGYMGHIPGKEAESVHGTVFGDGNQLAQTLRTNNPVVSTVVRSRVEESLTLAPDVSTTETSCVVMTPTVAMLLVLFANASMTSEPALCQTSISVAELLMHTLLVIAFLY